MCYTTASPSSTRNVNMGLHWGGGRLDHWYSHTSTQGHCTTLASLRLVAERLLHCRLAWVSCQMQGRGRIHLHSAPTLLKGSPRGLCHQSDQHLLWARPREPHLLALQQFQAHVEDSRPLAHCLAPGVLLLLDPLLVPGASLLLTSLLVFGASPRLPPFIAWLLMQSCTATWLLE